MDHYLGLKLMFMEETFGLLEDLEEQCRVDIEDHKSERTSVSVLLHF